MATIFDDSWMNPFAYCAVGYQNFGDVAYGGEAVIYLQIDIPIAK